MVIQSQTETADTADDDTSNIVALIKKRRQIDGCTNSSNSLGKIFVVFRNLFNLTQTDLCEILGIGRRQTLGDIESGKSVIPYSVLYRFHTVINDIQSNSEKLNCNYFQKQVISLINLRLSTLLDSLYRIPKP